MYGLVLCLPRVGQPQGLPVPHETPKNRFFCHIRIFSMFRGKRGLSLSKAVG